MPSRVRGGLLGGLAGGSLAAGIPWTWVFRSLRGLVESDALPIVSIVVLEGLVASTAGHTVLSWLLVVALLYVYIDAVYLTRLSALTSRRGFRVLTVASATAMAALFPSVIDGSGRAMVRLLLVIVAMYVLFGLYLRWSTIDVFDPDGVVLALRRRVTATRPAELLASHRSRAGPRRHLAALQFYSEPAAIFTVSSAVLGLVMTALLLLYPLPELAVLGGLMVAAVRRYTPVEPPGGLRSRLHLEARIVEPLSDATATVYGASVMMVCLAGLVAAGVTVSVGLDAVRITWTIAVPYYRTVLGPTPTAGLLWGVVVASPVALIAWGLYTVWYWVRAIQRLPSAVAAVTAAREPPAPSTGTDTVPPVRRVPGANVPMNLLGFLSGAMYFLVLEAIRLPASPWVGQLSLTWALGGYLLAATLLAGVCGWTIRSALTDHDVQPVDRDEWHIAVAFVGMVWAWAAVAAMNESVAALSAVGWAAAVAGAIVMLIWYPRLGGADRSTPAAVPLSNDGVWAATSLFALLVTAGFLHWQFPAVSPWLPAVVLCLAGLAGGWYGLEGRH